MSQSSAVIQDTAITALMELLSDDVFEKKIIKAINEDVDIPMINEKTEKKVFKAIFKVIKTTLQKEFKDQG